MTTLIVGCGYLGTRVGRALAERGETVIGTTRSPQRAMELERLGIRPLIADLLAPGPAAWPVCDRFLFCVAPGRGPGASPRGVYVDGLRSLLIHLPGRPRGVLVSTTGVYHQDDGSRVDETSPAEPTSESGRANLEAEAILLASPGRGHAVLRLAGLYGPGRILRREAIERGAPIVGDPDHILNLIHLDDAARFAIALLDRDDPPHALYLASDDRPAPRRSFYEAVARRLNAPPPRFEPGATSRRDLSNKRIDSRRIKRELALACLYPDFEAGLDASLDRASS